MFGMNAAIELTEKDIVWNKTMLGESNTNKHRGSDYTLLGRQAIDFKRQTPDSEQKWGDTTSNPNKESILHRP